MVREVKACTECNRKCLLSHAKKQNSTPLVSSFFKVMIGDEFSKVLYIPPKFAREVSALLDQEIFLEDCREQRWNVKLTMLKGSFALHQGWDTFASNHRLEVGDFLVLHYIMGSHFVVQIFDKSGCEQLDFSEDRNQKTKARTDGEFNAKNGSSDTNDKSLMNIEGSTSSAFFESDVENIQGQGETNDAKKDKLLTSSASNRGKKVGRPRKVCKVGLTEEPCGMEDTKFGGKKVEQRSSMFNFSSLKKLKNNSGTGGSKKIIIGGAKCSHYVHASLQSKNEVGLGCNRSLDKVPLIGSTSTLRGAKSLRNDSNISSMVLKNRWIAKGTDKAQPRKMPKKIKIVEDDKISNLSVGSHDEIHAAVKLETQDIIHLHSPDASSFCCLVEDNNQTYLELPAALPPLRIRGRTRKDRRVVLLRDSDMRQWPVLYCEAYESKLLLGGWEAFCKANNIRPGDECTFAGQCETEDVFQVSIVRK